jgi:hypothetical protein
MTESFVERTAGIWIPLIIYAAGGVYILAFWAIFSLSAYHLLALGVASLIVAALLANLSKWAYWLGVFTFPLLVVEFAYALLFSVNVAGWDPNITLALFNGSLVAYLVLLCLAFLLLIDRRNALRSDRLMERLRGSAPATEKEAATAQAKTV